MTAIAPTSEEVIEAQVDNLRDGEIIAGLEEFLQDPIGYGDFDFSDPMSLDEFSTTRHMHCQFAAGLA